MPSTDNDSTATTSKAVPTRAEEILGFIVMAAVLGCIAIVCLAAILVFGSAVFVFSLVRDTWHLAVRALGIAILCASMVHAQPPPSTDIDVTFQRLSAGDRAGFDGILAPEAVFVDWRTRIVLLESELAINADASVAALAVATQLGVDRIALETERRALENGLYQSRIEALAAELVEARDDAKTGFFEQPGFWFGFGVLVTVLAAVFIQLDP